MKAFRALRIGSKDFNSFWSEFQRLSSELDYSPSTLIAELTHKLSLDMKKQLAIGNQEPTDIYEYAHRCQRIFQALKDVESSKASYDRMNEGRKNVIKASTPFKPRVDTSASKPSTLPSHSVPIKPAVTSGRLTEVERE